MRRMSSSHVPRTCAEATTIQPRTLRGRRSAFLRLVRVRTERQQKCSLPQFVTTTHPAPERRNDPAFLRTFPAPLICSNCASPEHSTCDAPGLTGPGLRLPEAIIDRRSDEVLFLALETYWEDRRNGPDIAGVRAPLAVTNKSAIETFIGVQSLP